MTTRNIAIAIAVVVVLVIIGYGAGWFGGTEAPIEPAAPTTAN